MRFLMVSLAVGVGFVLGVAGCKTQELSNGGARVAISPSAPIDSGWDPSSCKSLGYLVGRGGGSFGGGFISNNQLIKYAMNDLRNQAAKLGANFVQHDPPTLGEAESHGNGSTTTATISGTAYLCTRHKASAAPTTAARPKTACVPGSTQRCVGRGGCTGGQACLPNGSGYSSCNCGQSSASPGQAASAAEGGASATH